MKKYDISFLKNYIDRKDLYDLSEKLNIDYFDFYNYLMGEKLCDEYTLSIFLKYYKVNTYEELKFYIESYTSLKKGETLDEILYDVFNLNFLKPYLKLKEISEQDLAYSLDISLLELSEYLNEDINPSFSVLKKLYKIFNVNSYKELNNLVLKDNTTNKDKIKIKTDVKKYNISFLNDYFKENYIKPIELSKLTGISRQLVSLYIRGECNIPEPNLNKILELFNFNSYEELENYVKNNESISGILFAYTKSNFLLNDKNINIINSLYNKKDILFKNENILDYSLENDIIDDESKKVVYLLFNTSTDYSINEISYITNCPAINVISIYKYCILKYLEKVYTNNVFVRRLKYEDSK